ncbi:redoxin family protein [Rhodopirellula sp. MGV]|uniref:redoxin family protein n=1 Tax=Rhodopirellula sp. MGV TaxID=2023130 RepID=UPI000B9767D3|nr:redoxin family protein [Rhodopirellula sp. MGV]OYP36065.1 hypothetical protein CGZ80_09980 [Rhodopirellula sp. MGV]PNY36577.1 hypothetical protein C2E31_12030 [Rhodopirellula baltica]
MRYRFIICLFVLATGPTGLCSLQALLANEHIEVDFDTQIQPLITKHCAGCHRPGQVGPFPLRNYDEVADQALTIQAVIDDGYMPPWKPVNTDVEFAGVRSLSESEKKVIRTWVDQGAKPSKRSPGDVSQPTVLTGETKWSLEETLGPPDLVVKMPRPFAVPADGPDLYRSFIFPVALPNDRWIKAMELRPSSRGAIHHALFFVDPNARSRQRLDPNGQPGFSGMSFLSVAGEGIRGITKGFSRGLGGYVPGSTPNALPEDYARHLPAGSDIIMQTHFHPIGRPLEEQSELAVYFSDQPPANQIVPVQIPSLFGIGAGIDIPAGEADYTIEDSFELPVDVRAIEVGGHAHYLCKKMCLTATLPDGQTKELLRIDDWDLDWQDQYMFAKPIALPKATKLHVQLVYDNTSANPNNPFSPPQRVRWGRQSNDEMGSMVLNVAAYNPQDGEVLKTAIQNKTRQAIRSRVESQTWLLRRLSGGRPLGETLMMLLDRNRDGQLQASEIPQERQSQLMSIGDQNSDGTIDHNEMRSLQQLWSDFDAPTSSANPMQGAQATTLDGSAASVFQPGKTTVVVFIKQDCPIANAYLPELESIRREYGEKGIDFVAIHSTSGTTLPTVQEHVDSFAIKMRVMLDEQQSVAKLLSATVTPQAVVVSESGEVLYRGRIDNRYEGYGKKRPAPTSTELRDALDDIVSGKEVSTKETPAIGCILRIRDDS